MADVSKILIIDDDESMLDSCSQIFAKEVYKTETAMDGETGLQKVKEMKPDLVLVDLKMPGKDGMEVLEELKIIDPNCLAIVITGYGTLESAVEAMKRGAYDFLPKPFTPDELRIIVHRGLERKRCILEAEFLRQEKEKMRENFVSMVSHELRSPLAAIQQNLMVITGGMVGEIPEKANQILLKMRGRIEELISLIRDWLDLSRIESGEMVTNMEPIDIKGVLGEVIDLLQPLADERKVTLSFVGPVKCHSILGNQETLHMLFTNLVHNGIKYCNEGGKVEIILESENGKIKVTVKDTGIGIPSEKLAFIFEQFYRVIDGNHVEGSGLGLSIAKKIVEAHDGSIDVESELGNGTTFTVCFP
jgi:signal transduction histidine kinase